MVQHLLHIIKGEAAKDGQTTVQPNAFGESERSNGRGRHNERGQARDGDDGGTREKRTANVQVLLLLRGGANDGKGSHHGYRVETGAGEERSGNKGQQGSDKGGLCGVEGSPERILGNIAIDVIGLVHAPSCFVKVGRW